MRINKLKLVAALVLGGLVACGTTALAQDAKQGKAEGKQGGGAGGGRRGGPTIEQLTEQLTLTDEQKPKVKAVLEDTAKKRNEMASLAPEERREKGRALMEEQTKKMKEILKPEQFEKYEKMLAEGRGRRPGGPGGAGGAGAPADKNGQKQQ